MNTTTIPDFALAAEFDHAARAVLGYLGERDGVQPGGFESKLIEAIFIADKPNQQKLYLGFRFLVVAVRKYKDEGPDALRTWGGIMPYPVS